MATLYDLLGALPDDDADGLRAAFRRAAKASHPDVNPGNPEAAERFRRIVRANAILSDEQQRAAYDRLLEVARRQQSPKPKRRNFSGTIPRLAADAIASAAVSAVLVGGYLLYKPVDGRPIASTQVTDMSRREPAQAPAATEISDARGRTGQHYQLAVAGADMKFDVNLRDVEAPSQTGRHCTCGDYRHRSCKRPCFPGSRRRDQGRPILSRTGHFGVPQRGSLYCTRQLRPGDREGSRFIRFLHQSRHRLPSPGRSEARIVRRRRGQAHRDLNRNKSASGARAH